MRCFVYVLALFVLLTLPTYSQNYVIVSTDASAYPKVSMRAYGFAADGSATFVTDGTVTEDGLPVTPTFEAEPNNAGNLLSCLVYVDASASMSGGGSPPNITLARSAALGAALSLNSTSDEIGLGLFDARPTLLHGLTNDKASYRQAVADLTVGSGCNLDSALLSRPEGALVHLGSARYSRMLLLVLDGSPSFDVTRITQMALGYRIPVFIIGVRTTLSKALKKLVDTTGGCYTEGVSTEAEAELYANAFVSFAKNLPASRISYSSTANCDTSHAITVTSNSINRNVTYTVPGLLLPYLEWSVSGVEFGTGSDATETTVTLTARNKPITIQTLSSDDAKFSIVNNDAAGKTLAPNESIAVTVRYKGGIVGAFGHITIAATGACQAPSLPLRAGANTSGETLTLVSPNGGERVLIGRVTTIRWTNVLPSEVVRIDYTTNNGSTWQPITETATGLAYDWIPGPNLSSNVKVRVQRTNIPDEAIVELVGHRDPVYAAAFTYDDAYVLTGGHDATVRLWNATTGAQIRELGNHGGQFAWAVATHPSELIGASGGHDGLVNVYNLETGQRINTIRASSRVWSLDFSPDGNTLIIGADRSISFVRWTDGEIQQSIVVPGGPVYDLRYSNDGSVVVSAESDRAAVRSTSNYQVITEVAQGTGNVYATDISPDNKTIVTGGADFIIRSWDALSGNIKKTSPSYNASIQCIDYAPSGAKFVVGSSDGSAKIFDATTLDLQSSFAAINSIIYSVEFDAAGNRIVTGGTDDVARIWILQGAILTEDRSDADLEIVGGKLTLRDVNLGDVATGDGVERKQIVIENTGTDSLIINGWRLLSGDLSEFDIITPQQPAIIPASSSITLEIVSQPKEPGDREAMLMVDAGGGSGTCKLMSHGTLQQLQFQDAIYFGRKIAGQAVVDTTILLYAAPGDEPVTVTRTLLMGVQQGAFQILSGGSNFEIGAGQSHQLAVRFAPDAFGRFAAWIEFTLLDGSKRVMRLYGEGTGDARIRTSTTTLLFTTDQCENKPVTERLTVKNAGTSPLLLYSSEISGNTNGEFELLEPASFPVTLVNGDSVIYTVRFTPTVVGTKNASITISSNAIDANGGLTVIPIIARMDSVGMALSRNIVTFDGVNEGESAEQRISIFNTGSVPLRWPIVGTTVGSFRINAADPPVTPPGGLSEVVLQFQGGTVGNVYTATYDFIDTLCNRKQTLEMSATVRSYIGCTIVVDTVGAKIGSSVVVPVRIVNKVNFDRTDVTELHARFRVNGTILVPTGTSATPLADGFKTFDVTLPIPSASDVSANLLFTTLWGNDTASTIRVDSVWSTDTILVKSRSGQVFLTDLCREGGPRLLLRARQNGGTPTTHEPANVRVVPSPVADVATIDLRIVEDGATRVDLVDGTGRVLQTLVSRELSIGNYILPLDVSQLQVGMYTLQLITNTQHMSHRFSVIK